MPRYTRLCRRRGRRRRRRWGSRRPSTRMVVRRPVTRTESQWADAILRRGASLPPAVGRWRLNDVLLRGFLIVLGYLAGAVPVGVLVARASGGPDPRTIGSGRTGGTNALRALGRKWAAVVVAGDLLKGALPGPPGPRRSG